MGVEERKVGSGVAEDQQKKGCDSRRVVNLMVWMKVLVVETRRGWTSNDGSRSARAC